MLPSSAWHWWCVPFCILPPLWDVFSTCRISCHFRDFTRKFSGFYRENLQFFIIFGHFFEQKIAFFSGNSSLFRASTLFFRAKQTIFKKSLKNYQTAGNEGLTRAYTLQYRDEHKNLTHCISVGRVGIWSFGHLVIRSLRIPRKRGGTTIINIIY